MQVSVTGKQLDVGDALRRHADQTLSGLVSKYFGNPLEAQVVLTRDAHLYRADITVHVGRGIVVQSNGEATEPYPAFDQAAEKVAKRLRRHKRRLRDHHQRAASDGAVFAGLPASQYILGPEPEEDGADGGAPPESEGDHPLVVAEMATVIDTMTVGEAVMRMDLADLPALMFRNRAHGGLNMVYRRPDGHVGWVDPKSS